MSRPLFLKVYRVWKLFENPKLRKITVTTTTLLTNIAIVIIVDVVILSVWMIASKPMVVEKLVNIQGSAVVVQHECQTQESTFPTIAALYKVKILVIVTSN